MGFFFFLATLTGCRILVTCLPHWTCAPCSRSPCLLLFCNISLIKPAGWRLNYQMLPRPALGTQGTASLHGCPDAASSGGPYCPAWPFYRCCGGHPHLSRSQFQHAHPLRAPQCSGPFPRVQLAKRYCVGAARYARAERSNGKKTERYPLTPWQEHHWWIHLGQFLWNGRGNVNTAGWYSSVRKI